MMGESPILWEPIANNGPFVAFAAGCIIKETVYIHGGISQTRSAKPLSSLYRLSTQSPDWQPVEANGSPCLSHHCAVPVDNRYMLLLGGWNGRERCSDVYVFDTEVLKWITVSTTGFPTGAGLSSHTANLLSNGDILVIGREGSLRTQRRSGNAFILSGSIPRKSFSYKDFPLGVASRSGHTTTCHNNEIIVCGGRSDKLTEMHKLGQKGISPPHPLFETILSNSLGISMTKLPSGRKDHSATLVGHYILIYGGETFDGRHKEPVPDMFLIDLKSHSVWISLGRSNIGRAGHLCVSNSETIYIHGGVGEGNKVTNITYKLVCASKT